jgi:hypothetical protein
MSEDLERGGSFGWLRERRRSGGEGTQNTTDFEVPGIGTAPPSAPRRRRKKTGKRSNPEYEQASAYVRKKVRRRVTQALAAQEPRVDYSQLVEALLIRWLEEVGYPLEGEDSVRA